MSPGKLKLSTIPKLEKLKAGLGAAGVAAVGIEALSSGALGFFLTGALGIILQALIVFLIGAWASFITEVSEEETEMWSSKNRESISSDASDR